MTGTNVLIVGAGPVGLTLAIDLAWRGIDVTVVETRTPAQPPEPKCNHVAASTMEIFRRLGLADKIRNAGLPADYAHDVSYRTSFTGRELTRIKIPCRRDRFTATDGPDCNWPTPEPPHRMHLSMLLEDEIVLLVSASHPAARKGMSLTDFQRAVHVVPMPYSISQRGVIDSVLASMRINRDERVVVQSFTAAPYLLQNTDLVFTTTRHFAQFYADLLPLAIIPSPIAFPPMRFYQLWHERNHQSPGHRWLRRLLAEGGRHIATQAAAAAKPA